MNHSTDIAQAALAEHRRLRGKIEVTSKAPVTGAEALSLYYTPGVGAVSSYLAEHPEAMRDYTIKGNTVAVVSDGSAVLGLGNIGPAGAAPVMEGKAMLFRELAGVNAWPVVLDTQDTEEIIRTVKAIAPMYGGINLEDISAPRCFEIERRLREELDIPVMHDDQHGTAIVILAGLINAAKVTGRQVKDLRVTLIGAGAAGVATAKLLTLYGVAQLLVVDRQGIIHASREGLNESKQELAELTNHEDRTGSLDDALRGADVLIGVSGAGLITEDQIRLMNDQAIVFALANPTPEIMPDVAKRAGAAVVATGRSDFPNQVNNALGFPGIFKGALENGVTQITEDMKLAAAQALADIIEHPTAAEIIPSPFDSRVVPAVAAVIR
jgi:malate dehydrogenase (oxaloacetate-decarboxylating)